MMREMFCPWKGDLGPIILLDDEWIYGSTFPWFLYLLLIFHRIQYKLITQFHNTYIVSISIVDSVILKVRSCFSIVF